MAEPIDPARDIYVLGLCDDTRAESLGWSPASLAARFLEAIAEGR